MDDSRRQRAVRAAIMSVAKTMILLYNYMMEEINGETIEVQVIEEALKSPEKKRKRTSAEMPRIQNYLHTVTLYSGREFQSHFRLSRDAYEWLLQRVAPQLSNVHIPGRPRIDIEKQLLSVLWILSTPDSYRSVADRFGMSKGSLHVCFYRVISAITRLADELGKWPDAVERHRIRAVFKQKCGMEGVVGVVDGTYVPIKAPSYNTSSYRNRKLFHGITLQGICDDKRRFIDAFVGYPSSVSDVRIFRLSDIYEKFVNARDEVLSPHEFILGDKAYETKTFCVPPYKRGRNYAEWQSRFNRAHASARQVIERTFALFFGRFRRFTKLDMSRTDWIAPAIIAAVLLHNLCISQPNDTMRDAFEREGNEFLRELREDQRVPRHPPPSQSDSNLDGKLFRDQLAAEMGLIGGETEEDVDDVEAQELVGDSSDSDLTQSESE